MYVPSAIGTYVQMFRMSEHLDRWTVWPVGADSPSANVQMGSSFRTSENLTQTVRMSELRERRMARFRIVDGPPAKLDVDPAQHPRHQTALTPPTPIACHGGTLFSPTALPSLPRLLLLLFLVSLPHRPSPSLPSPVAR